MPEPSQLHAWMNHGGPGITGCDPRPGDVDRFVDASGEHWSAIDPGGMWFRCEETDRGARYWTDVLSFGPLRAAPVPAERPGSAAHGAEVPR
jgi:hypothetical protein